MPTTAFSASPVPRSVPDSQNRVERLCRLAVSDELAALDLRVDQRVLQRLGHEAVAGRAPCQHQHQRIGRRLAKQRFEGRAVQHELGAAVEEAVRQIHGPAR